MRNWETWLGIIEDLNAYDNMQAKKPHLGIRDISLELFNQDRVRFHTAPSQQQPNKY